MLVFNERYVLPPSAVTVPGKYNVGKVDNVSMPTLIRHRTGACVTHKHESAESSSKSDEKRF